MEVDLYISDCWWSSRDFRPSAQASPNPPTKPTTFILCSYIIIYYLSGNKSYIILIESFKSFDWLHTLNIAFNYLLINYFSLDQQVSPPKPHSSIKLITFVIDPTKPPSLIKLITLVINFYFNLVLIFIWSCKNNPQ
jgi:hypothetical protein